MHLLLSFRRMVAQELIHDLWAAFALPMKVLGYTKIIDGAWAVVSIRAKKAGIILARVLMSGALGHRQGTGS